MLLGASLEWLSGLKLTGEPVSSEAMRHYLMTAEEHFAAAVKGEPKAAQQVHVKARNTSQIVPFAHEKNQLGRGDVRDREFSCKICARLLNEGPLR